MKTLVVFLLFVFAAGVSAQIPHTISYQGLVTDPAGAVIPDGNHALKLSLYESASGGSVVYTETQLAAVFKGLFHLTIGAVTPIPSSLAFDKQYFLGVSVDGGAELAPRTALTAAPYALRALNADAASSLTPNATGVVTSINNQSGALTLVGGGGTTVTNVGSTITISSTGGGGTGVTGVQSIDGSISITNPNGPTANLSLADLSVSTQKVIDKAILAAKIGSGAATIGQVLTADGSGGASWASVSGGGGLTLPYAGTVSSANTAFSVTNTGTGDGGNFIINNITNNRNALTATTNGTNVAAIFSTTGTSNACSIQTNNANNTNISLFVTTTGKGGAGMFMNSNAANAANILTATTNGTGSAGEFTVTNAASSAYVLTASTNGSGYAVSGSGKDGCGVFGISSNFISGYFQNVTAANTSPTLKAQTVGTGPGFSSSAFGVGRAGEFIISNAANGATALDVSTNGGGNAGRFTVTNAASTSSALHAATNGTGSAVSATTTGTGDGTNFVIFNANNGRNAVNGSTNGTGSAGNFSINNVNSTTSALFATTNGTAATVAAVKGVVGAGSGMAGGNSGVYGDNVNGYGVFGSSANSVGVIGSSNGNCGVYGVSTAVNIAAVLGDNNAAGGIGTGGRTANATGTGVYGIATAGGTGVYGTSSTGIAGSFAINNNANTANTLEVTTSGTGNAIKATRTITTGLTPTILAQTSSTAAGSSSIAGSSAILGEVTSTAPGNWSVAIRGYNHGTGGTGTGVIGYQAGSGYGVYGEVAGAGWGVLGYSMGAGVGVYAETQDNGNAFIANIKGASASTIWVNNIAIFQSANANKARIDRTGKGFFNGGTQTGGADVAEAFAVVGNTSEYAPGDVLVIASGRKRTVEKCASAYSTKVLGVHATKPGVLLTEENIDSDLAGFVPMGVMGVLPTNVCNEGGAIEAGDLLVTSSKAGYAMKGDPDKVKVGNVLGKALEDFTGASGTINVFVNVK